MVSSVYGALTVDEFLVLSFTAIRKLELSVRGVGRAVPVGKVIHNQFDNLLLLEDLLKGISLRNIGWHLVDLNFRQIVNTIDPQMGKPRAYISKARNPCESSGFLDGPDPAGVEDLALRQERLNSGFQFLRIDGVGIEVFALKWVDIGCRRGRSWTGNDSRWDQQKSCKKVIEIHLHKRMILEQRGTISQ